MADLTLTITEAVTLNGTAHGATNTQTITGVSNVLHRIVSVPTSGYIDLTNFASSASGVAIADGSAKHIRITNLDSTNFVTLRVRETSVQEYFVKIEAKDSFILGNSVADANAAGTGATVSFTNIDEIEALADTGACEVEIFIAS
tara:strand:- start:1306 stop:1740 length:435 start_codon:yes stop_codon:yes gene_type:complete